MQSKKVKWLVYTVLIGLIPILSRILMWIVSSLKIDALSAADFIAFGLVLHISNINELEHVEVDPSWKTVQNGFSVIFVAFYSFLYALTLLGESVVNVRALIVCSIAMAAVSFLISYAVYAHLTRLSV